MRYNKILKSIRSKYAGTSEEHDLLRKLCKNFDRAVERLEDNYVDKLDRLDEEYADKLNCDLAGRMKMDISYWNLQKSFDLSHLIKTLRDRRLTKAHIQEILDAWPEPELRPEGDKTDE